MRLLLVFALVASVYGCPDGEDSNFPAPDINGHADICLGETGICNVPNNKYKDCADLKTVTFHQTQGEIGQRAFQNSGLTSVNIPDNVWVNSYAFFMCTDLDSATIGTRLLNDGQNKPIHGSNAFRDCTSLKTVTFANEHLIEIIPLNT